MNFRTFRAASTICEAAGWKLSNLPLQKLLYLSHMMHLGRYDRPLIDGHFEAWDLGPVQPELYRKVRAYGDSRIPNVFPVEPFIAGMTEHQVITEMVRQMGKKSPAALVNITHDEAGAWAKHYHPRVKGIEIPDSDIKEEYFERSRRAEQRAGLSVA